MYIKATGEKSAEMVTDQGAIYVTSNKGYNWRAAVQETVSATLNRFISGKFKLSKPFKEAFIWSVCLKEIHEASNTY